MSALAIARMLGISRPTLYRYYRRDLDVARDNLRVALLGKTIDLAMAGDAGALILLTQGFCGWSNGQTVRQDTESSAQGGRIFRTTFPGRT